MAKVTGSQLKVKGSQQSVQPVPASPKASLMKDSEGGDSRYQGRGAFLPGQRMVFVRCFWRAGTVRVPARPGYAGIPPARYAGYAGILPACSGPGTRASCPPGTRATRASCPHAAARVRRHPARPVCRVRGHPARKAAARVRGHPARKAAARVRGHPARMQRCDLSREREHYED